MAQLFADAARAYLSAGINNTDTTVSIAAGGSLFPVANGTDWFKAVLQDASGIEIVYVTAHTSGATSFTVTRGQEGTTARSFAAGAVFGIRVTSADMAGFAGKLSDAPSDGKTYGRKDAAWAEVVSGATYRIGDVQIAPTAPATGTWLLCDGATYLQSSYAALYAELGLRADTPGTVSPGALHTLPSSTQWCSIAFGNGVFVATSLASSSAVATSPDGVTWTARSTPVSGSWESVAFGNGLFVAVGQGSANVITSPDGITWTARSLPSSQNWRSVSFNNGLFHAFSLATAAATSTDGINWTARTVTSTQWAPLAYGHGLFVTVSTSSTAQSSPNGINWTSRTIPIGSASVAFGNGVFVAVGGTNAGATSTNGTTWTARTLPTIGTAWRDVVFADGVFVAYGQGNIAASSVDGITWATITMPSTANWLSAAYGASRLVAVASSTTSAATSYVGTSYDPTTQFIVPRAISTDINSWIKAA